MSMLRFKKPAEGAMLHSDHDSIDTAQIFREPLKANRITQSLSRVCNYHDNALIGCLNGTLKVEALYDRDFSGNELTSFMDRNKLIEKYINVYKQKRPHSTLNYLSPYEKYPLDFKQRDRTQLSC